MNLSHENKLLLYCAQTKISEGILNQIKDLLSLPLNWEEVLNSAFWHGIAPLVYHNLKGIQESHFSNARVDSSSSEHEATLRFNWIIFSQVQRYSSIKT